MAQVNRRVLLVDDQTDFLEGVRRILVPQFEVSVAQSGVEALQRFERHGPFALVVSDFGMPGMTGIELLAELRARWPETVRIMLTGCADLGLALEALEQGAIFRSLTKPPAPSRLLEAVSAGVERFRQAEETRLFTEQLLFAQESLRSFHRSLENQLDGVLERMDVLERHAADLERAASLEQVLTSTSEAVRNVLGVRAAAVALRPAEHGTRESSGARGFEIVPGTTLTIGERRALGVLSSASRLATENLQHRERRLESRRSTLRALESLARHRDHETGEHLARVSEYCCLLASALQRAGQHSIDQAFIEDLRVAAPLHDIGKVAVPDAILLKPDKLDEREWEIMRMHPTVGADILRATMTSGEDAGCLRLAHELTWTHHERWDGQGYPRGLAGEEIPLVGRIMALADCYDALTSERPYKHAWSHAEALDYVREQRGRHFDPALVDVFLAHLDEVEAVLLRSRALPSAA